MKVGVSFLSINLLAIILFYPLFFTVFNNKVVISNDNNSYEIENYTGMNLDYVKGILETHGILVYVEKQDVEFEEGKEFDANEIIGQDVEPGEKLTANDKITLYVPNVTTKYPNFVAENYSYEDIEEFCSKYNVTVKKRSVVNTNYPNGTIIAQSRDEGSTVVSGTVITITVVDNTLEEEPEE